MPQQQYQNNTKTRIHFELGIVSFPCSAHLVCYWVPSSPQIRVFVFLLFLSSFPFSPSFISFLAAPVVRKARINENYQAGYTLHRIVESSVSFFKYFKVFEKKIASESLLISFDIFTPNLQSYVLNIQLGRGDK